MKRKMELRLEEQPGWMTSMDFADGIVLLSPDSEKMQDKTDIIAKNAAA